MRTNRAERIREIQFVLDRPGCRLPGDVIHRPADGVQTRHQRGGAFQELDLREIGRVHPARRDALWADRNPIVQNIHLAEAEAPHGESGGRAGRIDGQYAHRAIHGFGGGPITLLPHRLLIDDLDRCGRFTGCEAQPARAFGDDVRVEWCRIWAFPVSQRSGQEPVRGGLRARSRCAPRGFRLGAVTSICLS